MNPLISTAIVALIIIGSVGLVLSIGQPVIDKSLDVRRFKSADDLLSSLDKQIEIVSLYPNSTKIASFYSETDGFETIPEEDAIQFSILTSVRPMQPFSRFLKQNKIYISGNDVSCSDNGSLVMYNTYLKAVFKKINGTIDSKDLIDYLTEKLTNTEISISNSSIVINNDTESSHGTGYTEILKTGTNLPVCTVHAFINSTYDYDVYFRLYSYSDFLVVDVSLR